MSTPHTPTSGMAEASAALARFLERKGDNAGAMIYKAQAIGLKWAATGEHEEAMNKLAEGGALALVGELIEPQGNSSLRNGW